MRSHYNYFIDFFFYFFLFLFFHLCSSVSLIFSTLFSFLKTLSFFSNFWLISLSIFPLLCEGLFFCRVGVVGHAMGMGVVGHRHCGNAVGMVSHRFRVMPWVWVCAMVFVGLAMGFVWWVIGVVVMLWVWVAMGLTFCGCGFIFLGSCGLILVVVVVADQWLWFFFFLDKCGCDCCLLKYIYYFIAVSILF